MKMVAAAKLKRAQDNAEKSRPYANKMKDIVFSLPHQMVLSFVLMSTTNLGPSKTATSKLLTTPFFKILDAKTP